MSITLKSERTRQGDIIALQLELKADLYIGFVGIDLGPLQISETDKVLIDRPGFIEKSGVVSATTASQEKLESSFVAVLAQGNGSAHLAGIGALHDEASSIAIADDSFRVGFKLKRLLPAGTYQYKIFTCSGDDPLQLLQHYGAFIKTFGRKPGQPPSGWNSWDFYGAAVSMDVVEQEMQALGRMKCRSKLEYLTLDMGWEEAWGDWIPNRKFPETFKAISSRIIQAGFKPGIWLAPLHVSMFTQLARYRQDLFLRNKDGSLIIENGDSPIGPVLLLDFTLAEVRELVGSWFREMRNSGFDLFKIDYLYSRYLGLQESSRTGINRVAFTRLIYQTIRDAVGQDAHIVNCGGSKEAAIGLVDSSRVSMDIHNFWGHIKNNARQIANSFWLNRNAWHNDPDFAIIRHTGNTDAPYLNMPYTMKSLTDGSGFWMAGPEANEEELKVWLSMVRLNGGSLFFADSIHKLSASGKAMIDKLFPGLNGSAIPLDLFENSPPSYWLAQEEKTPTLGIFNWSDSPQTFTCPDAVTAKKGRDFWTGETIDMRKELSLQPHTCLLIEY